MGALRRMASDDEDEEGGVEKDIIETDPSDLADTKSLVEEIIPADIRSKYDVVSYRKAAAVLRAGHPAEFEEILQALRDFTIALEMIRRPGGNESKIVKRMTAALRPLGWNETTVQGDLLIRLQWAEKPAGKGKAQKQVKTYWRRNFLDGHKIDFVKGRVAFDFEWNSKDQTFDRDLYAFRAFSEAGAIDVAVIVTRSASLNPVFKELGQALDRDGKPKFANGKPMMLAAKYGASTTWWGKLIYRLNAGRNGGCPVLVFGIRPECISDLDAWRAGAHHSAAEL